MRLTFAGFVLDTVARTLARDGLPVPLGVRAFDLLRVLASARGQLVTKEALLDAVWPGRFVEEANIHVQVSALRRVLGADAIATVQGLGYRFARPVVADAAADGPSEPRPAVPCPAGRTPFVGREALLDRVQALLDRERAVTLTGLGGTGKTRIAQRLAHRATAADVRVVWLDLTTAVDPVDLASDLASAAGCRVPAAGDALAVVAAWFADTATLVVLDDCESALDAAARMAGRLLDAAPGVRVLATSREPLGLAGECVVPVPPMALPPPDAPAADVASNESVRLFLQSAARARADASVDRLPPEAVAALCRRLDGLPLAIELAAAQLRVVSVAELPDLLTRATLRPAAGHGRAQATVDDMIAWSLDRLDRPMRGLMHALAVAGPCDLALATALRPPGLDEAELPSALARLADLSLLVVSEVDGRTRYGLLDTVRLVVTTMASDPDDLDRLRDRHARALLDRARATVPRLRGHGRGLALDRLERDRDPLLRALDHLLGHGRWQDAVGLVEPLAAWWIGRGRLAEGGHWVRRVASRLPTEPDPPDRPAALQFVLDASTLLLGLRDAEAGRALLDAGLRWAAAGGHAAMGVELSTMAARCDQMQGDPRAALHRLEALVERADARVRRPDGEAGAAGDDAMLEALGGALDALGHARLAVGDRPGARDAFARSLVLDRLREQPHGVMTESLNLADVAIGDGNDEAARRHLAEAAAVAVDVDDHYLDASLLELAAALAVRRGDWTPAARFALLARRLMRALWAGPPPQDTARRRLANAALDAARDALDEDGWADAEAEVERLDRRTGVGLAARWLAAGVEGAARPDRG